MSGHQHHLTHEMSPAIMVRHQEPRSLTQPWRAAHERALVALALRTLASRLPTLQYLMLGLPGEMGCVCERERESVCVCV